MDMKFIFKKKCWNHFEDQGINERLLLKWIYVGYSYRSAVVFCYEPVQSVLYSNIAYVF